MSDANKRPRLSSELPAQETEKVTPKPSSVALSEMDIDVLRAILKFLPDPESVCRLGATCKRTKELLDKHNHSDLWGCNSCRDEDAPGILLLAVGLDVPTAATRNS